MKLALLGPASWRVCNERQVEYKTDSTSTDPDQETLRAAEVFCRVTLWNNEVATSREITPNDKLALILKLEPTEGSIGASACSFNWAYFDLQDLVTPGLDTRPWFSSIPAAVQANCSRLCPSKSKQKGASTTKTCHKGSVPQDCSGDSSPENAEDYWAGVSSGDESALSDEPCPPQPCTDASHNSSVRCLHTFRDMAISYVLDQITGF